MIVFENREKLRCSARKMIVFENAEKLRSARRVIAENRRFAKLWNIAELDRIGSKKRVFEKPKQAAEQKNGVLKNIGKARTISSLAE